MDADQSPHQLSSCLSLSGASGFSSNPLCAPPCWASHPPHINYSLSPVAPAPLAVTPESGRSEVVLPTATPGISQKFPALFLKPCCPAGRHPHDPRAAEGAQRSLSRLPPTMAGSCHSSLAG
ncbi:unnamed protein product [Pleuronectes platessa]|uniref:Uncharacterized protein n=1 Tax=Pleuronectes platessa TaxID=8262 RepID=A0A9N7Y7G5_PLEPL|nr:unnamed protein product [Pleuronectes platessa]